MECSSCGEPTEPAQISCPACGALTVREDPLYQSLNEDPPTELMAASERPDGTPAADEIGQPSPPTAASPPAALAPEIDLEYDSAPEREPDPPRRRPEVVVATLAIGIAVFAGLIAVATMPSGFLGLLAQPAQGPVAEADQPGESAEETGNPTDLPPEDGFACSQQSLSAPETGRWRLYRSEFGRRAGSDFLRLRLRREGGHEQIATATAEVVRPEDLSQRYDVAPPGDADSVLVVSFNGPVDIGGPWSSHPGYAAMRGFEVKRGREGSVQVVVAVAGDGCFRLSAGDWETGQSDGQAEVALQIQRP